MGGDSGSRNGLRSDGAGFAADVFAAIADRMATRAADVAVFTETGSSYEAWCVWEGVSALREAGCSVTPRPPYTSAGVTGSRDRADLLVLDPTGNHQVVLELATLHDWTTNKWIDDLDAGTQRLSRTLAAGVVPLQLIMTASLESPIELNPTWRRWLEMSVVWKLPTPLKRTMRLGHRGELALYGWVLGHEWEAEDGEVTDQVAASS